MVILDTNVVSALMHGERDGRVAAWLNGVAPVSIWTTSITVFEVTFGLETMSEGKRRLLQQRAFERILEELLERRIARLDSNAAREAALLAARRRAAGRPHDLRDTLIAGIAVARRATLATRNTRHFADLSVPVVDPWAAAVQ